MQDIGLLSRPGWECRERAFRMHLSSLSYHLTWLQYKSLLLKRNNRRNRVIKADILVLLYEP